MPSLVNTNAGPASALTLGEAAARVARVVGLESDPTALQASKDCLSEAVDEWNRRHNWRFLQIVAPDIAVSGGTQSYALPTAFKRPYDAYLLNNRVKLKFCTRQTWDSFNPGDTSQSTPVGYTLFNVGTTGNIELVPIPTGSDTLVVRYFRDIITPVSDGDVLDVPKRYEGALIAMARGILASLKNSDEKAVMWTRRGEEGYKQAKADDIKTPDEVLSFDPEPFTNPALNINWTGWWMYESA